MGRERSGMRSRGKITQPTAHKIVCRKKIRLRWPQKEAREGREGVWVRFKRATVAPIRRSPERTRGRPRHAPPPACASPDDFAARAGPFLELPDHGGHQPLSPRRVHHLVQHDPALPPEREMDSKNARFRFIAIHVHRERSTPLSKPDEPGHSPPDFAERPRIDRR